MKPSKIAIAIHDLNPWGGQDKSNLEILFHVGQTIPLDLHSYSFVDPRSWSQTEHVVYRTPLKKPAFFKSLWYSLSAFFKMRRYGSAARRRKKGIVIQSTGTASPVADVIQVQFIHKTWINILRDFNVAESEHALRNLYYSLLGAYNVLNEEFLYTPEKKYIAISHSIKKELIEHFDIPEKNIQTIYHGVNTAGFYPASEDIKALEARAALREQLGLKPTDIALLHVGALNQRKGILNSIKTLGTLKKKGVTNVFLIAVGNGDKKNLMQIAAREGVSDEFKIISHTKNVRDYYWASDIFFFPSIYEPFGLVILEAMACGLPCLISGHAGATELITNHENGIILQNIFDTDAMTAELDQVIKDPDLRARLGKNAHATALTRNWNTVANEYLEFYSRLFES